MQVNRSSYYEWRASDKRPRIEDLMLKNKVQLLFEKSRKTYGSRRLVKALKAEGYKIGRFKVRSLMEELKLEVRYPKRFRVTTDGNHSFSWPVVIAVDETLERRKGKKIKAKGLYRDAVRSSQSNVVTSFGLKLECMTLIVPLPWCKRPWALPFFSVLAPSKKSNEKALRRHKTSLDWTRQMVKIVSRWLKRPWLLLGDGA
jgi:hypothetical protein